MSILPVFQKYKRHIRIGDDYILDSEWTHAKTVEMSDGSTLDDTVANINREITATKKSVSDGKSAVASAITAQGVTTAADATFDVMAANITAAGDARYSAGVAATKVGTAAAENVLSGKTFTNASAVGLTGTMADYSADPQTVTLSSSQTGTSTLSLPTGYHSSVKVNAANVYSAGITAADARTNVNSANYQAGYNAGVAAGKLNGNAMGWDAKSTIPLTKGGYVTGDGTPNTAYVSAVWIYRTTDLDINKGALYRLNDGNGETVNLTMNRWWTRQEIADHAGVDISQVNTLVPYDNIGWVSVKISS